MRLVAHDLRRLVFSALLALLTFIFLELASLAVYRLAEGRAFSYSTLRETQEARQDLDSISSNDPGTPRYPHQFLREDILHPYLGFTGNPDLDPGFSAWGFWGALGPPPPKRSPERLLVGIFGGSLAADFSELGAPRLAERLSSAPRWAGREIVVLNAAHGGYKQPQQLMALAWVLSLGAELDVAINLDGFNDIVLDATGNAHQGVHPAFPRGWALRIAEVADRELLEAAGEVALLRRHRADLAVRFAAPPWRWSVTAGLLWTLLDRRATATLDAARLVLETRPPAERRFVATGPPRPDNADAALDLLVDVWARGSRQLDRLSRANGIVYLHALQPNQYLPGSKPIGPDERRRALDAEHPYRPGVEVGYPRLRERGRALRDASIPFVDLTQVFADVEEPLYIDTCCHLGERGHALLADALADALLDLPAPPPALETLE